MPHPSATSTPGHHVQKYNDDGKIVNTSILLPKGPFPCVRMRCVSVCVKNGFLLVFFSCFHVCVIRIGLREVSVVRETESLLERFFHALRTLRTANCTLFSIAMVEIFDIKANI